MTSLPRLALLCAALVAGALALGGLAPEARANPACDLGTAPAKGITGGLGLGDPLGDVCDAVTNPALGVAEHALDPLGGIAKSLEHSIFEQITGWAAEGAAWLLGEVVTLTNQTTTPDLLGPGFLRQYRQMAAIAASMAVLMLIFAVLESLGRGESGLLVRTLFVNLPTAAIATSCAYVVVQLLIAVCDGFSAQIAHHAGADVRHFFEAAIGALSELGSGGGEALGKTTAPGAGQSGAVGGQIAVPLFVGFIAAILAALGAFMVWIELLMRDAAIYAVALFMPFALAASIWPRWAGALRRSAELIAVLVFSKFAIVATIALAASLLAHGDGGVEQVLAAAALLAIACLAPFVLLRLIPFAESAIGSAYSRQSAAGASVRTSEIASAHMMRRAALSHWAESAKRRGGNGEGGSGGGGPRLRPGGGGKGPAQSPSGATTAGGGLAASPAGAAAVPAASATAASKAAGAGAKHVAGAAEASPSRGGQSNQAGAERPPRPRAEGAARSPKSAPSEAEAPKANPSSGDSSPRPAEKPPRPPADLGTTERSAKPKDSS